MLTLPLPAQTAAESPTITVVERFGIEWSHLPCVVPRIKTMSPEESANLTEQSAMVLLASCE